MINRIAHRIYLKSIFAENIEEAKGFIESSIAECKSAYTPVEVSEDLLSTIITKNGEEVSIKDMMGADPNMINRNNEKKERFVPSPYKIIAKSYQDYLTKLIDTESVFGSAFKTAAEASMKDKNNVEAKEKTELYTNGLKEINQLVTVITDELMQKFSQINELGFRLFGRDGFNHATKQGITFINRLKVFNSELKQNKKIDYRNYKNHKYSGLMYCFLSDNPLLIVCMDHKLKDR